MKTFNEKDLKKLPKFVQEGFLKTKIKIMIEILEKSGLMNEFNEFVHSPNLNEIKNVDDLFVKFAQKYPEKLEVVPEKDRTDQYYYFEMHDKDERS